MANRRSHNPLPITLALLLALLVGSCAFPEEGFDGDLQGDYYINGFDQAGTEYGGSLTIVATENPGVFDMQWIITGSIQTGTGTVSGDRLTVEWQTIDGYGSEGSATYSIGSDGQLVGERRVSGEDGVGTEEAFPIR